MTAPSSKSDATTSDPVYQKNPHPAQAYRITMTIEDAPGPFRMDLRHGVLRNDQPRCVHTF